MGAGIQGGNKKDVDNGYTAWFPVIVRRRARKASPQREDPSIVQPETSLKGFPGNMEWAKRIGMNIRDWIRQTR